MQARAYLGRVVPGQQCIHASSDRHALGHAGALLHMPGIVQAMEYMGTGHPLCSALQHVLESTAAMHTCTKTWVVSGGMLLNTALTTQAREYLGQEDPTQQSLQYVLESSAAVGNSAHGLPYLPTGNLVSGLPAALMSCCQASTLPGRL